MTRPLETEQDVKLLVDTFYDKVNRDPLLAPIFNEIAKVDWEHHLPTMYSFWSSLLLGAKTYKGQPFPKHLVLPGLTAEHFDRWIALFHETLSELFQGDVAENARQRASVIAQIFQTKLGITPPISLN